MAMWGDDDDDGVGVPQERRVANGDLAPPARPAPVQAQRLQVVDSNSPAGASIATAPPSGLATPVEEPTEEPAAVPRAPEPPPYEDEVPPLVTRRRPGMSASTKGVAGIAILALAGTAGWVIYSNLQRRAPVEDIVVMAAPTAPSPAMAPPMRENPPTNQQATAPTGATSERGLGQVVVTQEPAIVGPTPVRGRGEPMPGSTPHGDPSLAAAVRENLELNQRILQTLQGVVTELSAIRAELDRVQRRVAVAEAAIPAPRRPVPAPTTPSAIPARPVQIAMGAAQARPPVAAARPVAVMQPGVANAKGATAPAAVGVTSLQSPPPQPSGMFAMAAPPPAVVPAEPVAEPARVQTAVAGLAAVGVGNRTVYVRPGDTVPGYGKVKSIDPARGQLLFENGTSISQ